MFFTKIIQFEEKLFFSLIMIEGDFLQFCIVLIIHITKLQFLIFLFYFHTFKFFLYLTYF